MALELLRVLWFVRLDSLLGIYDVNCLIQVGNIGIERALAEEHVYTHATPSSSVIISREHLNADNRRRRRRRRRLPLPPLLPILHFLLYFFNIIIIIITVICSWSHLFVHFKNFFDR